MKDKGKIIQMLSMYIQKCYIAYMDFSIISEITFNNITFSKKIALVNSHNGLLFVNFRLQWVI